MNESFLDSNNNIKKNTRNSKREEHIIELEFINEGLNLDISKMYHWHINFPYYTGKGYRGLKLEDYHYFSENNQFGQNLRGIKGGSIRAFQENIAQMVQLVKVNLMPLLKEVKEADFLKKWFDKIVENDEIIQNLLKKGVSNTDSKLKSARDERNEAISHIKDRWVNEVDGGRLWQMGNSQNERGLDFTLTPQLFMGVSLDNPLYDMHKNGKSIKEQLDSDIYSIDITQTARESVARFMYKFHSWLPTAIKDTNISFKIKIASLKQFYMQLQMYVNFMKPLLIEISRKSEGFNSENFFREFESENPDFVNIMDTAYSFIKILGIRNFDIRGPNKLDDLEFNKHGLFLKTGSEIMFGANKGKIGYIKLEKDNKYEFYETKNKNITTAQIKNIKPIFIEKCDLKVFPVMEFDFSQKRRNEIIQTQQGPQQIPYMRNSILYKGFAWNIYEIATYRESLKEDNLKILESFIGEIKVVRDDLLYYVNDLEFDDEIKSNNEINNNSSNTKQKINEDEFSLILGPFKAMGYLLSPLIPNINLKSKKSSSPNNKSRDSFHESIKIQILEDTWKMYTINKLVHGFMQY